MGRSGLGVGIALLAGVVAAGAAVVGTAASDYNRAKRRTKDIGNLQANYRRLRQYIMTKLYTATCNAPSEADMSRLMTVLLDGDNFTCRTAALEQVDAFSTALIALGSSTLLASATAAIVATSDGAADAADVDAIVPLLAAAVRRSLSTPPNYASYRVLLADASTVTALELQSALAQCIGNAWSNEGGAAALARAIKNAASEQRAGTVRNILHRLSETVESSAGGEVFFSAANFGSQMLCGEYRTLYVCPPAMTAPVRREMGGNSDMEGLPEQSVADVAGAVSTAGIDNLESDSPSDSLEGHALQPELTIAYRLAVERTELIGKSAVELSSAALAALALPETGILFDQQFALRS